MEYEIKKARPEDLPTILEIYAGARAFMAKTGNPNQWKNAHPPRQLLEQDIREGNLYVLSGEGRIHGVFAFFLGEDPTYRVIQGNGWRSSAPYGTIHRIAGDGSGGILHACIGFCREQISYLRIDTHEDNRVMQGAVKKEGFVPCGIIHIADGSPRIAYDLL
ncbi:MAG: N-acetyltransferase [Faecousia sp.]